MPIRHGRARINDSIRFARVAATATASQALVLSAWRTIEQQRHGYAMLAWAGRDKRRRVSAHPGSDSGVRRRGREAKQALLAARHSRTYSSLPSRDLSYSYPPPMPRPSAHEGSAPTLAIAVPIPEIRSSVRALIPRIPLRVDRPRCVRTCECVGVLQPCLNPSLFFS
jgi:hypothetical protein